MWVGAPGASCRGQMVKMTVLLTHHPAQGFIPPMAPTGTTLRTWHAQWTEEESIMGNILGQLTVFKGNEMSWETV